MGRRKPPMGYCHICGEYCELSFEHVPPRAAFNNRRVVKVKLEEVISLGPDAKVNGPIQQKGAGSYALCHKCNNLTGHWYGRRFVDWCYQGMDILIRSKGKPSLLYLNYLFPLAILKQIITMFLAATNYRFAQANPALTHFVLNREEKYLPPQYRFFTYYNIEGMFRSTGISVRLDVNTGRTIIMNEISFPPFGYLLTLDSDPPDKRLFEITFFSQYSYNEFAVMSLQLPVLPTHLPQYAGDYRTRKEINNQVLRSKKYRSRRGRR